MISSVLALSIGMLLGGLLAAALCARSGRILVWLDRLQPDLARKRVLFWRRLPPHRPGEGFRRAAERIEVTLATAEWQMECRAAERRVDRRLTREAEAAALYREHLRGQEAWLHQRWGALSTRDPKRLGDLHRYRPTDY